MRRLLFALILLAISSTSLFAEVSSQQRPVTSWPGLTGLYIIPTARLIGRGTISFGFNEAKHAEFVMDERYTDRQIRAVVTYGVANWFEVSTSWFNNLFMLPPDRVPGLENQSFSTFDVKFRLLKESDCDWYPEFSIAVRDLLNRTADVGPLNNVHNGRKLFLLASKKIIQDKQTGRFMDAHGGITLDHNAVAGLVGFELALSPNVSFIAECMWDSPFLDYRNYGNNNQPGRFIFDPGIRIYPELVKGLALDLGFIGDSEFEFSFGASYTVNI